MAQHWGWWPYHRAPLGSAFYTNISANTPEPASASTSGDAGDVSDNSGGTASSSGSDSGSGGSSTGGSGGGSGGGGSSTDPILNFAADVNVGSTKEQINGQASGLGQNCAVVVSAVTTGAGKQEVCTYTDGDKIVTVTYLNGQVISASKSGF